MTFKVNQIINNIKTKAHSKINSNNHFNMSKEATMIIFLMILKNLRISKDYKDN